MDPKLKDSEASKYILQSVHEVLKLAVCDMILNNPPDPVEFIAEWLYAYRGLTKKLREEQLAEQTRLDLLAERRSANREKRKLRQEFRPSSGNFFNR